MSKMKKTPATVSINLEDPENVEKTASPDHVRIYANRIELWLSPFDLQMGCLLIHGVNKQTLKAQAEEQAHISMGHEHAVRLVNVFTRLAFDNPAVFPTEKLEFQRKPEPSGESTQKPKS